MHRLLNSFMSTSRPDMKADIQSCDWMVAKIQASYTYAQNLYAGICNNVFQRNDVIPILKNWKWSASWRAAAGIVGEIRGGDYGDFYCSGPMYDGMSEGISHEGTLTHEIQQDLLQLGWVVVTSGN